MTAQQVARVITNWREADLDEQERAMLAFTEKLALAPDQIGDQDVEALRLAGFDEDQVLAIGLAAAYRSWVSRIADLLGVEEEKFDFPEEILAAFGVTREQLQTSLYAEES